MHVRKLKQSFTDIQNCQAALQGKPGLDADVLAYPATTILVAEDGKDTVFMPVQTAFLFETMGYKEGISDLALASAMKLFTQILVWEGRKAGHGELYFIGTNEETNQFALNNGFEEVKYRVFRLRHEATPMSTDKSEGSHEDTHQNELEFGNGRTARR